MRRIIQQLIDDLDGSSADETVSFGLDGRDYTIDLSTKNAYVLRTALDLYVEHGQRVSTRIGGRSAARPSVVAATSKIVRDERDQVRRWAQEQGLSVAPRGRISQSILDRYAERDQTRPAAVPTETGTRPSKRAAALDDPAAGKKRFNHRSAKKKTTVGD
jgi:hypothetical protein